MLLQFYKKKEIMPLLSCVCTLTRRLNNLSVLTRRACPFGRTVVRCASPETSLFVSEGGDILNGTRMAAGPGRPEGEDTGGMCCL